MLLFICPSAPSTPSVVPFQYISCYCLSSLLLVLSFCKNNFNTSHVTVYPVTGEKETLMKIDFNTSHVTVYHPDVHRILRINIISIHLMLLFIWMISFASCTGIRFQYISCYCLSFCIKNHTCTTTISIHLMLLFIT